MCRLPKARLVSAPLVSKFLLFSLLLWPAASLAQTFTFTAIPDQDESRLVERFGRVERYLEERLGNDVRYVPVKSYAAAVTAFRNNQVQLAWFGGLSGVQARRLVPDSVVIAQGAEDQAFKSYIIANTAIGLEPGDLLSTAIAGHTFTFGSKGSTSGRLMPEFFIRELFDKAPEDIFRRVGFSGDHSRTIDLVESGVFEIGAVNFEVWETELANGRIDTSKVQVIWETPAYPDYQWTARGDLRDRFGTEIYDALRDAFLSLDDPDILSAFPRSGFVSATEQDYLPILETARAVGLID